MHLGSVATILSRRAQDSVGEMRNGLTLVPDARLARLASERGPASAEAYVMLELREVRSGGDEVFAFEANGRYIVRSAPEPGFWGGSPATDQNSNGP